MPKIKFISGNRRLDWMETVIIEFMKRDSKKNTEAVLDFLGPWKMIMANSAAIRDFCAGDKILVNILIMGFYLGRRSKQEVSDEEVN